MATTAVEGAEHQGEDDERGRAGRLRPHHQHGAGADIHQREGKPPADPGGDAGEQEAADGAADAQQHDQQHAEAFAQANVAGIGGEMHERHEQAERHQERAGIDRPERAGAHGLAQAESGRHGTGAAGMRRIAVGGEAVALGRRAHQRAGHERAHHGQGGQHDIALAPAEAGDQHVCQRGAHQRSHADAGDGEAARGAATAHEPALHRRDAGHIGEADAHADAQAIADIDLPQAACLRRGNEADGDQQQAADHNGTRADAVGDQAGGKTQLEVEEGRDREDQRRLAATGAELALQYAEECREGIGDGKARHHAQERAGHDPPAGKNPVLLHFDHEGKIRVRRAARPCPIVRSSPNHYRQGRSSFSCRSFFRRAASPTA